MKPVLVKKATITPGQYRDYLEDSMYLQPIHHSFRLQPEHYKPPALGRELTTSKNVRFAEDYKRDTGLPLSVQEMGVTTPLIEDTLIHMNYFPSIRRFLAQVGLIYHVLQRPNKKTP